ncbi:hypothetical protein P4597_26655 [Peribacillus simplex]|uniref:hypothetical protein n=1 Tax=Peribacillus simplex TaxID=1478 RepID=UPI002E235FFC|nr:hypothetical protein [Peribacillus simplex]
MSGSVNDSPFQSKRKIDVNMLQSQLSTDTSFDNYSTILTKDAEGDLIKVEIKDGAKIIKTTNIIRDLEGDISSVEEILNGKTVVTTINRNSDGTISSTEKEVL